MKMRIEKIKISNFKSFDELEVKLDNFNVLIGQNASGKSNFIEIFRFLRDICKFDLINAVSMQGGANYLRNMSIKNRKDLHIGLELGAKYTIMLGPLKDNNNRLLTLNVEHVAYDFSIKFNKRGLGYNVSDEALFQEGNFAEMKIDKNGRLKQGRLLGQGFLRSIRSEDGTIKEETPTSEIEKVDYVPFLEARRRKLEPKHLIIRELPSASHLRHFLESIACYDFDPKLSKRAVAITGKADLEEDGSNLAIVLKNIAEGTKTNRDKFASLLRDNLPFISDWDVQRSIDKSLIFTVKENYFQSYMPSAILSDGTINIISLIVALYFERTRSMTIIEEPERAIHPSLLSKAIDMIKDISKQKQLLLSTHNTEIVKFTELQSLLLVSRNKYGFSVVAKPAESSTVKTFLENEMGLEELFVDNLLQGPDA